MLTNAQATTKGAIMLLTNLVFISLISFLFDLPWLLVIELPFLAVHRGTPQNLPIRYAEKSTDLKPRITRMSRIGKIR